MPALVRDGVRLVYHEQGGGEPAMLLVHGWCCDHTYLAPQAEHFGQRHRVVSVDLRGHGESDKPVQEYTIEGYADDVAWLCGQLGLRSVVAIGHSMGGQIAFGLATQRPELVAAMVLIEAPFIISEKQAGNMAGLIAGLRSTEYAEVARGFVDPGMFVASTDQALRERIVSGMSSAPQHVMASSWEHLIRYGVGAHQVCTHPTLLIDARYPRWAEDEEQLRATLPSLEIETTPGLGHFNHLEDPELVNGMIEGFLSTPRH